MVLFFSLAFSAHLWGQNPNCFKIQFTYDNAGNRIQRKSLTCAANLADEPISLQTNKQDNNSAMSTKLSKTDLKAYPNPNNGVFQVFIESPQENTVLDLYDFTGRKLFSQNTPSADVSMNVSNLVTGTYILVYRNTEKILSKLKLVIE